MYFCNSLAMVPSEVLLAQSWALLEVEMLCDKAVTNMMSIERNVVTGLQLQLSSISSACQSKNSHICYAHSFTSEH